MPAWFNFWELLEAASGSGDKGRGLGHNWSPKFSLRASVTPGANASHSHNSHWSGSPCCSKTGTCGVPMAPLNTVLVTLLVKVPAGKDCVCAINKALLPKIRLLGCTLGCFQRDVFPKQFASSALFIRNSLWTMKRYVPSSPPLGIQQIYS